MSHARGRCTRRRCLRSARCAGALLAFLLPAAPALAASVETAHLVVDDVERQLSAAELERFAADAERAYLRAAELWSAPERAGKVVVELHREQRGASFSVFRVENGKQGRRSVVSVHGVTSPQELVHKLTHALFPTEDKLIRNMMGIPTELRFGNPRSFPMCGFGPDAWVRALRRAGSYLPLAGLGKAHEDWGMTFEGGMPVVLDRARQHASYAEAGSFGDFLLRRFGAGKVKAFVRAAREQERPWRQSFGLDLRDLEAEWLRSLEAGGAAEKDVQLLTALWNDNPRTACTRAAETAAGR